MQVCIIFCSILFQNFVLLYFCVLFFYNFFIYFVPFSLDKVLPVVVLFKIVFDGIIYCWRFVLGAARYHETTANLCDAEKQTTHPTIMQNGTKKWLSEIGDRPYTAEFPGDRKLAGPLAATRTPCGEHDRPRDLRLEILEIKASIALYDLNGGGVKSEIADKNR